MLALDAPFTRLELTHSGGESADLVCADRLIGIDAQAASDVTGVISHLSVGIIPTSALTRGVGFDDLRNRVEALAEIAAVEQVLLRLNTLGGTVEPLELR